MRLVSSSSSLNWSARDSLKAFVKEKFERKHSEFLDRSEWIDFGSMASESTVQASNRGNGKANGPSGGTSLFWIHDQDEDFNNVNLGSIAGGLEGDKDQSKSPSRKKTLEGNSNKTTAQKWGNFIRSSYTVENTLKNVDSNNDENPFRMRKARSVGALRQKMKKRRSLGLHDISNQPAVLKPMRGRRSNGSDGIKLLAPNKLMKQVSLDMSKLTFKDKNTHFSRKTHSGPLQSPQTPKTSTTHPDDSLEKQSPETEAITSPVSDKAGFKKLLNLYNSPQELQQSSSEGSPLMIHRGTANNSLSGTEDSRLHPNHIKKEATSLSVPLSKGPINTHGSHGIKSIATEKKPVKAPVILEQPYNYGLIVGDATQNHENEEQWMIQNFTSTTQNTGCECSMSAFSGNEDLIMFFLPKVGMACNCGHNENKLLNMHNPTALENILRQWQVDFVKSFGIHTGEEFIKSMRHSSSILARGLRQWRKKNDMTPFKTTSCATALEIWSKVCKSYIRSIRRQTLAGYANHELEPADATLIHEMKQFLGALPGAPHRRSRTPQNALGIEVESQMEV